MNTTSEQARIDRACNKLKKEWDSQNAICIFCLQLVRPFTGQLCHKIRRSESSNKFSRFELQTMRQNTGPGHPTCHTTYDDEPELAKSMPGYPAIMQDVRMIDENIYLKRLNL